MVMYSVTDDQSFNSCSKWLERVKAQRPTPELPLPGMMDVSAVTCKRMPAGQTTLVGDMTPFCNLPKIKLAIAQIFLDYNLPFAKT